jgi:putative transposase
VSKDYRKTAGTSATDEPPTLVTVPDVVRVAMNEIAADIGEGLLALAVGAGVQVMAAMMAADVDALRAARPARPGPDRHPPRQRGRVRHPRRTTRVLPG